jgi:hypothetical protein
VSEIYDGNNPAILWEKVANAELRHFTKMLQTSQGFNTKQVAAVIIEEPWVWICLQDNNNMEEESTIAQIFAAIEALSFAKCLGPDGASKESYVH